MNVAVERIYREALELKILLLDSNLWYKEVIDILIKKWFKTKEQATRAFIIIKGIKKE